MTISIPALSLLLSLALVVPFASASPRPPSPPAAPSLLQLLTTVVRRSLPIPAIELSADSNDTKLLRGAKTLQVCTDDADCDGSRVCQDVRGLERGCLEKDARCVCLPPRYTACAKDADCEEDGEICAGFGITPFVCMAKDVVEPLGMANITAFDNNNYARVPISCPTNENDTDTDTPAGVVVTRLLSSSSSSQQQQQQQETLPWPVLRMQSFGKKCNVGNAKRMCGSMQCLFGDTNGAVCCNGSHLSCACIQLKPSICEESDDCEDKEACVRSRIQPPFCVAESIARDLKSPDRVLDDDDDDVIGKCIAAHHLSSHHDLVYPQHVRATVLCDALHNCATPGHVVVHRGVAMRMSSYCASTTCRRSVMLVNSPRFRRALLVPSHSHDLQFTALAARFETRAEEIVLSLAVRFGL